MRFTVYLYADESVAGIVEANASAQAYAFVAEQLGHYDFYLADTPPSWVVRNQ